MGKRLTRSTERKLGGVCGGLAEYLDIDPTVMRVIFAILFICGSLGLWAYLVMWLLIPER